MMVFGPESTRADEAVESVEIHRIFETVLGQQKRVEFPDLPIGQRAGLDWPYWHVPFHREALVAGLRCLPMIITQEPTQSLAALHGLFAADVSVTREQQNVALPLMIPLNMVMLDVFAQRPS
jgi:hypothetical protein